MDSLRAEQADTKSKHEEVLKANLRSVSYPLPPPPYLSELNGSMDGLGEGGGGSVGFQFLLIKNYLYLLKKFNPLVLLKFLPSNFLTPPEHV